MKILVVSNNYPSMDAPAYGVFVYNIVQQFVQLGHEVTVIANRSSWDFLRKKDVHRSYGEELAKVYYPKSISASNKQILNFNTHLIGEYFSVRALKNTVINNNLEFDVVYAHFLVNGINSVKALFEFGKPIFVAEGEFRNINRRKAYYKPNIYKQLISKIKGFIAVSPQIKENLVDVGVDSDKVIIKPNGIDPSVFYKRDKKEMRLKHNLPLDDKLVIFVGRFVEDKGPLRVLKAIQSLDGVGAIFVGGGNQELESDKIVFKNRVNTNVVPELLSAADVFVLPTLHEGSCNAIIEAMACGLPIISSRIPEIQFQCDSDSSILVDPMNVEQISNAISSIIYDQESLEKMGLEAIKYAKQFDLKHRAESILNFIEERKFNYVND